MANKNNSKAYINALINEAASKEDKVVPINSSGEKDTKKIIDTKSKFENKKKAFAEFSNTAKTMLLAECMYRIFSESLDNSKDVKALENTQRAMINSFIEEQGVSSLINSFKYKSSLLAEYSALVIKYHKLILENVDKDNECSFCINPSITDDFYKELDTVNADEAIFSIRTRVMDAENEFLDANTADQLQIKELLSDIKDKIDNSTSDTIKEEYQLNGKRKLSAIKNKKSKNIYEAMVFKLVEDALTDASLKTTFIKENKIDMLKITESVDVLYTFLEMLNSTKMIDITEEYIADILK